MAATLFASLALLAGAPALAFETKRTDALSRASSAEVAKMLLAKKHEAHLAVDSSGDPMLRVDAPVFPYQVLFYGCREGTCETLQFLATWETPGVLTESDVNALNRDIRDGRVHLDADGNPTLDLVVHLAGGISEDNLSYVHERFLSAGKRLARRIDAGSAARP